ncbi:MAG: DUF2959 domain-containing protein [Myxococcota bacterium]|nr:DUF2959 domain-containing protein [Myxococcota bacterium]
MRTTTVVLLLPSLLLSLPSLGCRSLYYDAMEGLGKEKRHILRDRVEAGRDDQREAQEQFQTTLEAFRSVTGFDGGDLEDVYEDLDREYQRSEAQAEAVRERIASIEQVSADLFEEWESEIGEISNASLRRNSQQQLRDTRRACNSLIAAMQQAAERMDPVLTAFRDRVLYLKHNLNARAIASLEGDLGEIEADVDRLIREMNSSIAEAESFLSTLG